YWQTFRYKSKRQIEVEVEPAEEPQDELATIFDVIGAGLFGHRTEIVKLLRLLGVRCPFAFAGVVTIGFAVPDHPFCWPQIFPWHSHPQTSPRREEPAMGRFARRKPNFRLPDGRPGTGAFLL